MAVKPVINRNQSTGLLCYSNSLIGLLIAIILLASSRCNHEQARQEPVPANDRDGKTASFWISKLNLQAHPGSGYYREIYRSNEMIGEDCLPSRYQGNRALGTSIYFLVTGEEFSAFHRLKSDEIYHFYAGCPLLIYIIDQTGALQTIRLGSDPEQNEAFQALIPHDHWIAAKPIDASAFSLIGCTVSPGFDFSDFEMGRREVLVSDYPQHRQVIKALTLE
ncbi:cupin domain-containing protein [candidate division KSB1 bacterium]|nr:cupin domain-containing protein [candidate division KSB1 bacterium]